MRAKGDRNPFFHGPASDGHSALAAFVIDTVAGIALLAAWGSAVFWLGALA